MFAKPERGESLKPGRQLRVLGVLLLRMGTSQGLVHQQRLHRGLGPGRSNRNQLGQLEQGTFRFMQCSLSRRFRGEQPKQEQCISFDFRLLFANGIC